MEKQESEKGYAAGKINSPYKCKDIATDKLIDNEDYMLTLIAEIIANYILRPDENADGDYNSTTFPENI